LIICNDWRIHSALATTAIAEFRKSYPRVQIVMKDMHIHEQIVALREQKAHVGFVVRQSIQPKDKLNAMSIARYPMFVVMPATHDCARKDKVKLADLAEELWIFPTEEETP